jgi:hypothetical protein
MFKKINIIYCKPRIKIIIRMYISSINNEELLWRYVPWIMEKDQALAVRVI